MTPLKQWLRRAAERWLKQFYEGPDPPARITEVVIDFSNLNQQATRADWAAFASRATPWLRRADGMARGAAVEKVASKPRKKLPKPAPASDVVWHPTEVVAIADLKPHHKNYKVHPDGQLVHIAESLKQHGGYRNVVIARDGTLLAGHGVVEAAQKLGLKTVAAVRLDVGPDEPGALKVLAADNELVRFGEVDDRALTELLKHIGKEDPTGLLGTGYDEKMLAALVMVTRPASEIRDINEAAEWVGMPEYDALSENPQFKLVVTFRKEADRKKFVNAAKLRIDILGRMTWSTRWPFTERVDGKAVRFEVPE